MAVKASYLATGLTTHERVNVEIIALGYYMSSRNALALWLSAHN